MFGALSGRNRGTDMGVARLKAYLSSVPELDAAEISKLLALCWDQFRGGRETDMHAKKFEREIEQPIWHVPFLEFLIERHPQTVYGSTRGTVQKWRVNLETLTAEIVGEKRRQLYAMDKRLDVKPIAAELAKIIVTGQIDERVKRMPDASVRLNIALIIPETNAQTTAFRRKRLRRILAELLAPHGWNEIHPNVYKRKP